MDTKPLTKEMIGLDRVSPTMLQDYEDCPLNFYYRHWLGLQLDEDRMHMDFGNAVQRAIEHIYAMYDWQFKNGWEAEKERLPEVIRTFRYHWPKHIITEKSFRNYMKTKEGKESGFTSPEDLYNKFKEDGEAIIKSYWDRKEDLLVNYGLDLDEFEIKMRVEMHNPADPADKLPIPLSGRIDCKTRDNSRLGDFKTSKGAYNEEESKKKMQCRAYPFAWLMDKGVFIPNFDYIVLRKGLKNPDRVQIVSLKFDEADMVSFYVQVKSILTRISNKEFGRPASGHPPYCSCYKYEEALKV